MRARTATSLLFVASMLAPLLACRQIVGIDEGPPENISNACGLPQTGACGACVARGCCDVAAACAANPACLAYETCFAACGDEPCRAKCVIPHHVGHFPELSALRTCIARTCESECDLECGGLGSFFASAPAIATECQACLVAGACDGARAWATTPELFDSEWCALGCSTPDCRLGCGRQMERIAPLPASVSDIDRCAQACGAGTDWTCVGHVEWPFAKTDHGNLRINVTASGQPLADADVALCDNLDCTSPASTGKTDSAGHVELIMGRRRLGSQTGGGRYIQVTSPGTVPLLSFWSYPLTETDPAFELTALTPSELAQYLAAVSVNQDPDRGYITTTAVDCRGQQAPGVTLKTSSDATSQRFYFRSGVPSLTATSTDASGIVAISNVPAGSVDVTATPEVLGVPSIRTTVFVRAGALTSVLLLPAP